MSIPARLTIILCLLVGSAASLQALEIAPQRLPVHPKGPYCIPYISNYPIDSDHPQVRIAIIAVHSSNHDAKIVYESCMTLLNSEKKTDSVLVVAPQFLKEEHIQESREQNLLYWTVSPFWGSSKSTTQGMEDEARISAYTILEQLIGSLVTDGHFENLRRIVILGHSAGGQLVNRFAASNTIEYQVARPKDIKMQYLVMNPSSYVYFSPERSVRYSSREFAVPSRGQRSTNPDYNDYGYGLENLYAYHRSKKLTAEKMKRLYPSRCVFYLLGEKDNAPDSSMSTHPSAMLQGRNRLERGRIYYGHLLDEFGPAVRKTQRFIVIPRTGHSGRGMINSEWGKRLILGY